MHANDASLFQKGWGTGGSTESHVLRIPLVALPADCVTFLIVLQRESTDKNLYSDLIITLPVYVPQKSMVPQNIQIY